MQHTGEEQDLPWQPPAKEWPEVSSHGVVGAPGADAGPDAARQQLPANGEEKSAQAKSARETSAQERGAAGGAGPVLNERMGEGGLEEAEEGTGSGPRGMGDVLDVAPPRSAQSPAKAPTPGVIFLSDPGEPLRLANAESRHGTYSRPIGGGRGGGRREGRRRADGGRARGGVGEPRWRRLVGLSAVVLGAFIVVRLVAGVAVGDQAAAGPTSLPSPGASGPATVGGDGDPLGRGPEPSATSIDTGGSGALPAPVDWLAVMVELDRLRSAALRTVDSTGVVAYSKQGSPAHKADVRTVAALDSAGVHPVGLQTRIVGVEVLATSKDSSRLRVVDERSGYRLQEESGKVVQEIDPAGQREWTVKLAWLQDTKGWRIVEVKAA